MKIRMLVVTGIVCLAIGLAAAAEQPSAPQRMPERTSLARPGAVDREAAFRDMLAGRAQAHAEVMKELVDLKKLAEEENATKTAEAIQAMIDKKDGEYKKSVEQFERQRRERAEQLQKRLSERQTSREPAQPAEPAQPEKKDKKDK
jgi:hypothetical protein